MNDGSKNGRPPPRHPDTRVVTAGRDPAVLSRLRQSAGLSRLDGALSQRRGFRRPPRALPVRAPRHADNGSARAGFAGARRPAMRRRGAAAVGAGGDFGGTAFGRAGRRSSSRHRQRLRSDAQFLRPHPQPARRHRHLLRSAHRRRDLRTDAGKYPRRLPRIARLAELRDAGCCRPSPRRRMPRARSCSWTIPGRARSISARSIFGVDLSIQAGTKYIGGHSDVMLGTVSANARDRGAA